MTNRNVQPKPTPADEAREDAERTASFHRRVAAAGIDLNDVPQDMDEFRYRLARLITMYVNEWSHGCPQRLCRRNGGCMAPDNRCSNVEYEPLTPENWDPVRIEVRRALDELKAERPADFE